MSFDWKIQDVIAINFLVQESVQVEISAEAAGEVGSAQGEREPAVV